jgi:hypothetical protein
MLVTPIAAATGGGGEGGTTVRPTALLAPTGELVGIILVDTGEVDENENPIYNILLQIVVEAEVVSDYIEAPTGEHVGVEVTQDGPNEYNITLRIL